VKMTQKEIASEAILTARARCVFFDRDGVVNESPGPGYVERWEDFHLLDAFVAAARVACERGYGIAIITNQRGVARGLMTHETLEQMHARLVDELMARGIPLLGIYCCPHERDSCTCRKPQPGLLLQAAEEHGIDLAASWMIGDNETDVQAGQAAGCHTIRVAPQNEPTKANERVPDMKALPPLLAQLL
jgi:D-glycero-D-manno-heptose 1,7-bisphosphate phosphatase